MVGDGQSGRVFFSISSGVGHCLFPLLRESESRRFYLFSVDWRDNLDGNWVEVGWSEYVTEEIRK